MVTDSPYEGADLGSWAERLTTIATSDGPALLLNIFLSPSQGTASVPGRPGEPARSPARSCSRSAARCPEPMVDNARAAQVDVGPGRARVSSSTPTSRRW